MQITTIGMEACVWLANEKGRALRRGPLFQKAETYWNSFRIICVF